MRVGWGLVRKERPGGNRYALSRDHVPPLSLVREPVTSSRQQQHHHEHEPIILPLEILPFSGLEISCGLVPRSVLILSAQTPAPAHPFKMSLGFQRLNVKKAPPNDRIAFIKPLPGKDEEVAQDFLEKIAAQCCVFAPIVLAASAC